MTFKWDGGCTVGIRDDPEQAAIESSITFGKYPDDIWGAVAVDTPTFFNFLRDLLDSSSSLL